MSLAAKLADVVQSIGADIKSLFAGKQDTLVSGTNIKTVNGVSIVGSGNAAVSAAPAGDPKEVQFNNAGTTAGAANVEIDNGDLTLIGNVAPVSPPAGTTKLFAKTLGYTRMMPAAVGPTGMDYTLQPAVWRQKIGRWNPPGNATTVPGVDGFAATVVGTATARNVATTNRFTRMRRLGYVTSAALAGTLVSVRTAAAQFSTGDGAGNGGFFMSMRFGRSDAAVVAGVRFFAGMSGATYAPTNVEPNTLTNCIGIAQLSTDSTQLYLVYGGSAAQAAVALGTGFPPYNDAVSVTSGVPYEMTIWCPSNSNGVINWSLERLDTGTSVGGTITPDTPGTQTPESTTLMNPVIWACNNTTARSCAFDLANIYIETDY